MLELYTRQHLKIESGYCETVMKRILLLLLIFGVLGAKCSKRQCRREERQIVCYKDETDMAYAVAEQRFYKKPVLILTCIACQVTDPYSVLDGKVTGLEVIHWNDQKIITKNFNKLKDIKEITLQNITELDMHEEDFKDLWSLQELTIISSPVPNLPVRFFRYLKHLERIRISGSGLKTLDRHWFRLMRHLTSLSLSHNQISVLYGDMFHDSHILTKIELQYNKITSIPPGLFRGLTRLEHLDISYNPLMSVDLDAMFKHPTLTNLVFERIPCSTMKEKITPFLKLVSADIVVKSCRYGKSLQCLYLRRQNLPEIELKIYTSDETPGTEYKSNWMEGLEEYVPCTKYCQTDLISKQYGSDDPLDMHHKIVMLTEAIEFLRKKKIFTIEGLAAGPMLKELDDWVGGFVTDLQTV